MTLVLGINTGARLQLLADTRISHPDVTQVEEVPGRLKLITLSPFIAVGYAGGSDYALDTIRRAKAVKPLTAGGIVPVLLEASREPGGEGLVDFIFAAIEPEMSLVVIRNGDAIKVGREGWIGDADAASAFHQQQATIAMPDVTDPEMRHISRALQAFHAVIARPATASVGGLEVRVGSSPGGFRYLPGAMMYMPSQAVPSGQWTTLHFGGRAEGGFGYSLLVPEQPGEAVLAVHFFQGQLGFIYAPLLADRPTQVTNVSHEQLRNVVLERYGVNVNGLRFG